METVLVLVGAIVLILAVAVLTTKARWVTLDKGHGDHAEAVQSKYAYLQSKNIKSRMRTELGSGSGLAAGSGMGLAAGGGMGLAAGGNRRETYLLQVKPGDVERARLALQEKEREEVIGHMR